MNYTTPQVVIVSITEKDVLVASTDGYTFDYFNDENWRGGAEQ